MQETLEDFFKALRGSDLAVSLSAQIDAGRAIEAVGLADREVLKQALGTTLAKSFEERALFNTCFERFFSFDTFARPLAPAGEPSRAETRLGAMLLGGDRAGLAKAIGEAARAVGMNEIWFFTQKGRYIQRIQEAMGVEALEREIAKTGAAAGRAGDAEALRHARRRLFHEVRGYVEKQLALYGKAPTRALRDEYLQTQPLSALERRDLDRMHEIVRRIAKRLARTHSRRRKRRTRGALDFGRTLRASVPHDGIMFTPYWKRKAIERTEVIALCDVSGSVAAYARFLLLFLYSLNELIPRIRSFAFTSTLVETSAWFDSMPVGNAVDTVMKEVAGSGTDYGNVLIELRDRLLPEIDRKTTVLILGDARNNRGHPQGAVMELLHQRARRVIWLNPEPRTFWGLGDSEMLRYAPHCHVAQHCNSVKHLERAMNDLLRVRA